MLNVKRIEQLYHENNQYLPFESHYEDDGKLTEQMCCIVDPKKNKCLICVRIQTLKNLYDYKWGYTPQFYFDKEYNEFVITLPKFGFLTREDIANSLWKVKDKIDGLFFNIQLNGENYNQYVTTRIKTYDGCREDLKQMKENGWIF